MPLIYYSYSPASPNPSGIAYGSPACFKGVCWNSNQQCRQNRVSTLCTTSTQASGPAEASFIHRDDGDLSKQTRIRCKGGVTGLRKPDGEILNTVFQMQGSNSPKLDLSFVRFAQRVGKLKVWAGTLKQAPPGQDQVVFM